MLSRRACSLSALIIRSLSDTTSPATACANSGVRASTITSIRPEFWSYDTRTTRCQNQTMSSIVAPGHSEKTGSRRQRSWKCATKPSSASTRATISWLWI